MHYKDILEFYLFFYSVIDELSQISYIFYNVLNKYDFNCEECNLNWKFSFLPQKLIIELFIFILKGNILFKK